MYSRIGQARHSSSIIPQAPGGSVSTDPIRPRMRRKGHGELGPLPAQAVGVCRCHTERHSDLSGLDEQYRFVFSQGRIGEEPSLQNGSCSWLHKPRSLAEIWFPGSAWEPISSGLCPDRLDVPRCATVNETFVSRAFPSRSGGGASGYAFPGRAWERESQG